MMSEIDFLHAKTNEMMYYMCIIGSHLRFSNFATAFEKVPSQFLNLQDPKASSVKSLPDSV